MPRRRNYDEELDNPEYNIGVMRRPPEFFNFYCLPRSDDARFLTACVNQGIDSHLQAFTRSRFGDDPLGGRLLFSFHRDEIHIILRRLREMNNLSADILATDIDLGWLLVNT